MAGTRHNPGMCQREPELRFEVLNYCQSLGWEHYEVHEPEPHILLFK